MSDSYVGVVKITGAHVILNSKDADSDRAFIRDVLGFPHVDVGHGWLIFALPPAEVATHPGDRNDVHELYLMCEDVHELIAELDEKGIATTPIQEERWGTVTKITLPSGGSLGVYQAKHASPTWTSAKKSSPKKSGKTSARKSAPKKSASKSAAKTKSAPKSKSKKPAAKRKR